MKQLNVLIIREEADILICELQNEKINNLLDCPPDDESVEVVEIVAYGKEMFDRDYNRVLDRYLKGNGTIIVLIEDVCDVRLTYRQLETANRIVELKADGIYNDIKNRDPRDVNRVIGMTQEAIKSIKGRNSHFIHVDNNTPALIVKEEISESRGQAKPMIHCPDEGMYIESRGCKVPNTNQWNEEDLIYERMNANAEKQGITGKIYSKMRDILGGNK